MAGRAGRAQTGRMAYPYQPDPHGDRTVALTDEQRSWAMIGHLSALIATVISAGWLSFAGPFVVWLLNKDKSPFVRHAAASAFNFNIVAWLMWLAGWVCFFTVIGIPIALVLWAVAFVVSVWCHVRAAIAANQGRSYTYPWGITVLR